jgi:hypothetical protein
VAKLVSEAWQKLSPEEKAHWEERSCKDKARYEVEKAMYSGPWKVAANTRKQKNPDAPKRPMSAFLAFSNKRRAMVKAQNPNASNAELSKILSNMWKEAPEELRKSYVEEEAGLREKYHTSMTAWRDKEKEQKVARAKQTEDMVLGMIEAQQQLGSQSETTHALSRSSQRSQRTADTNTREELTTNNKSMPPSGVSDLLGVSRRSLENIAALSSVASRPRSVDELVDTGLSEYLRSPSRAMQSAAFLPRPYQTGLLPSYQGKTQK